ncbi:MAG: hypothetical protein FWB79_06400, partial [Treponema sp.]|nr:hypothetical protein [Treponema sp.]
MRITEHEASAIIEAVKAVDSDAQVWLFGSRADDGMMKIGYDEKLKLMSSLNWDYLDKHQDMLAVVEGRLETSGAFTRDKLFVRSLERLPWHYVVALWGVETIKELYTPEIAGRIWPKDRRYHFDFALAVLR